MIKKTKKNKEEIKEEPIKIKVDDGFAIWVKPSKDQIKLNTDEATEEMAESLGWKKIS